MLQLLFECNKDIVYITTNSNDPWICLSSPTIPHLPGMIRWILNCGRQLRDDREYRILMNNSITQWYRPLVTMCPFICTDTRISQSMWYHKVHYANICVNLDYCRYLNIFGWHLRIPHLELTPLKCRKTSNIMKYSLMEIWARRTRSS